MDTTEGKNYNVDELPDDILLEYIRLERNYKLMDCDKYILNDYPITEEKREEWKTYRQELRDITSNITSYDNITLDGNAKISGLTWPTPPS